MTESTRFLNTAQAAARLGVKPATLYAYVSRGLLPRRRAPDGRLSLFDPADLARLERRSGTRRGTAAEIVVPSSLTLTDTATGHVWYRGIDVVEACTERRFEEIAAWLWTQSSDAPRSWRPDDRTLRIARRAQAALGRAVLPAERLQTIASAVAEVHSRSAPSSAVRAGAELMSCLVDALPGPDASPANAIAARLWPKLTDISPSRAHTKLLDAALSVTADHALTYPTVVARISAAGGANVAASVAAALAAGIEVTRRSRFTELVAVLSMAEADGVLRAADAMDRDTVLAACSGPYPSGDPRARVLGDLLAAAAPQAAEVATSLSGELRRRGGGHATVSFAQAAVAWACRMHEGAGDMVALVSRAAGWIAHALEERASPTPYRPRLAYTGPPPGGVTPRRMLDAVQRYLARE